MSWELKDEDLCAVSGGTVLSAVPITKDCLVVLELVGRLLLFEHVCDSSFQISICGA